MVASKEALLARRERLKALRAEVRKLGIRYTNRMYNEAKLKEMIADPYWGQLDSFRRYYGINSFDFRGKGITPKPRAYVRWVPKSRYERQAVRGVGRFVADNGDGTFTVSYPLWVGSGYKDRKIRVNRFQIVEYREDR